MNKASEREAIASWLYDEVRVTAYSRKGYLPMWHELDAIERNDYLRKAARLQQWLTDARRYERQAAASA